MLTFDFEVVAGHSIVRPHGSRGRGQLGYGGGVTERSLSPAPTVEETVLEMAQQATVTTEPRAREGPIRRAERGE
jgi:hypothetical protein